MEKRSANPQTKIGKVTRNERLLLTKTHDNRLGSSCQVKENRDHLLLHCNKENICNILRDCDDDEFSALRQNQWLYATRVMRWVSWFPVAFLTYTSW